MSTRSPAQLGVIALLGVLTAYPSSARSQSARPEIEEIVTSASSIPLEARKVGSSITVITAKDLQEQGIRYVADALRNVPGVAVNRAGSFGSFTQIRLRGAESNHVLVLIDGIEVAPANSGEFDFSTLLTDNIERIEILRGPQSGLYGSNALAGVISVTTRQNFEHPDLSVSLESGSFKSSQLTFNGRVAGDRKSGNINVIYRSTEGVNISQLGDEKDGDKNLTISGHGDLSLYKNLWLDGSYRYVEKHTQTDDFDFTGGPTQGWSIDGPGRSNTRDVNLAARATWLNRKGNWSTQFSAAYTEAELDADGNFGPFGSRTSRTKLALQTTMTMDQPSTQITHFLTGFAEHEEENFRDRFPSDPSQYPTLNRMLNGIGIEYRTEFSQKLYLSAVLRHDMNKEFDDATTHRLTATYLAHQKQTRFHASYGTGVTNPTFVEQFGFIPNIFTGNPDLEPEKSTGWDVGIERSFSEDRVSVDVTYFRSNLQDEIKTIFPSVSNAAGENHRRGVEVSFLGRLSEQINLSGSYTHLHSKDLDGATEVRRPKQTANVSLNYRFPGERARIHASVIHNGSMLDYDYRRGYVPVKSQLDSYTLINLGGSVLLTERLEFYGWIENLFDQQYEEVLTYNNPGRGFYAGIRLSIN